LDERLHTVNYPENGPVGDYGLGDMKLHALYPIPDRCFVTHKHEDTESLLTEFEEIEANMAYAYSDDPKLQTLHGKCHAGMHLLGNMRRWDTGQLLTEAEQTCPCLACIKAKIHKPPKSARKKNSTYAPKKGLTVGDHVSADVKVMPLSESGYTAYLLIVDHATAYVDVYLLQNRAECEPFMLYYLRQFSVKHGKPVKNLHIDGGEMDSHGINIEIDGHESRRTAQKWALRSYR